MKRHTAVSNRKIGELCGGLSYSAVAKAFQRFSLHMSKDKSLQERIDRIAGHLSLVKP